MENSIYNKVAYQTFDLQVGSTPQLFSLEAFINKNYNLIEGFFIDFDKQSSTIVSIINEFKIDDLEILPSGFYIDNLYSNKSISFNKKFTPINIPIRQGKLTLSIVATTPTPNRFSITLKLKNVENEKKYFQDFFRYECHLFNLLPSPNFPVRLDIRPKKGIEVIKGIAVNMFPLFRQSNPNKNYQIGSLKMLINSKKSNPINIPIFDHDISRIKYKKEFVELDEKVEPGATINMVFETHLGSTQSFLGPAVFNPSLFVTIKSI